MRDASDDLKRFIQEDIQELSNELREVGILLEKLEDSKQNQMYAVRNIEEIKERLLSFGKYAKGAQPDVLVTLIQSFVERIYIVDETTSVTVISLLKVARKRTMTSSSGQPVTYLVQEKTETSHLNCLCVIQMSVANSRVRDGHYWPSLP